MSTNTNAAMAGATGLVGSHILATLLTHPHIAHVSPFTRKPLSPPDPHNRLRPVQEGDSSAWAGEFGSISPTPTLFMSALGTTRAQAGSFAAQRAVDIDLNIALARAAKEAGTRVYVLISSAGVNKDSYMPYPKMKGQLEEAVQALGFEKTVIVKPGLICGTREDSRYMEAALRYLANFMGRISGNRLKDFWAQDADVIGRAAVVAGLKAVDGSAPEGKTWFVQQADIVRFGRTEWKKEEPRSQ